MLNLYSNNELTENIKNIFTNDDMKIFEFNYNLYQSYKGKENDFNINFDEVAKYIGFSRKDHAKRLLIKHFTENIDYKMNKVIGPPLGGAKIEKRGGHNAEHILLNLNTFKQFCFVASTDYSKKIYNYYIHMEKIIHSFIETQLENNKKELEIKDKQLEIKDKLLQEKTVFCDENFNNINNLVYDEIDKSEFIYILSTDIDGVYKIGKSNSIPNRKNTLQTACVKNINILFQYATFNKTILENVIHYVFDYYRCKSNREHFRINLHYAINIIKISGLFLDTLKSTYENITFDEIIEKINNKLDTLPDILLDASQDNKLDDDILNNNVILLKNTNSSSSTVEDNIDTTIQKSSSATIKNHLQQL